MINEREYTLAALLSSTGVVPDGHRIYVEEVHLGDDQPLVSFVIPVHNQEARITRCLRGAVESATLTHEFVLVLDNCRDQTDERVKEWVAALARTSGGLTQRVVVVRSVGRDLFETLSDNIGFTMARGEMVVEIQADMVISHSGFDSLFFHALRSCASLFAVGGRGGHVHPMQAKAGRARHLTEALAERVFDLLSQISGSYAPTHLEYWLSRSIGRVGRRIDLPLKRRRRSKSACVYMTGTIMRGPFAVMRSDLEALGLLDAEHFFLGDDDHDLVYRAVVDRGQEVGYIPIFFDAPLEAGSTRVEKTPSERVAFRYLLSEFQTRSRELNRNRVRLPPVKKRIVRLDWMAD